MGVGYGTYIFIFYCINNIKLLYNYRKTKGKIKSLDCNEKNKCYAEIEYEVNNIKYKNNIKISKKLKKGDKIDIRYNKDNHRDSLIYENIYISIILLIIGIIILWILLLIVIIYNNKYIYLIYGIFFTIIITYIVYININNIFDVNNYQERFLTTKGRIKSQEDCKNIDNKEMCYSIIEYTIKGIKYNIKTITYNYKIGEELNVYYDKDYPEAINVYDKIENKIIIEIIIIIIFIILLWIFLLFNIPIILK